MDIIEIARNNDNDKLISLDSIRKQLSLLSLEQIELIKSYGTGCSYYIIGVILWYGITTKCNKSLANEYFDKSASLDFPHGLYASAVETYNKKDYDSTKDLLERACKINESYLSYLGDFVYKHGKYMNKEKEIECYKKSIDANSRLGMFLLARHYFENNINLDEALILLKNSVSLKCGIAIRYYATMYETGKNNTKKNISFARKILEDAILYIDCEYMYFDLGIICSKECDFKKSIIFFRKSIELGYHNAPIYVELGISYEKLGKYMEAEYNFKLAIDKKNYYGYIALAQLYFNYFFQQKKMEIKKLLDDAQQNGNQTQKNSVLTGLINYYYRCNDFDSMTMLLNEIDISEDCDKDGCLLNTIGCLYMNGRGIIKNYEKAKETLLISAKKGIAHAYTNLGVLYEKIDFIEYNIDTAIKYYKLGFKNGNHNTASINLGKLYYKQKNPNALKYLHISEKYEDPESYYYLMKIYFEKKNHIAFFKYAILTHNNFASSSIETELLIKQILEKYESSTDDKYNKCIQMCLNAKGRFGYLYINDRIREYINKNIDYLLKMYQYDRLKFLADEYDVKTETKNKISENYVKIKTGIVEHMYAKKIPEDCIGNIFSFV